MVREDTAIILNDDSVVSSFGFEKNLSTITAWVLILLLSYDKSTMRGRGGYRSHQQAHRTHRTADSELCIMHVQDLRRRPPGRRGVRGL